MNWKGVVLPWLLFFTLLGLALWMDAPQAITWRISVAGFLMIFSTLLFFGIYAKDELRETWVVQRCIK